ncbi:MAG TPA: Rv3235 family protein [Pseudonocardiaceae bacterium]|nr:Rv3235 family protein [Pseudonocardiaceae bacterium]
MFAVSSAIRPLVQHRVTPGRHLTLVRAVPQPSPPEPPRAKAVGRLLTGVLEVLDGRRPSSQLATLLPSRYQRALLTSALAVGVGPRTLRSVRLNRTTADAVDLCARIEHRGRSRAMTGRIALINDNRWEFTLLSLV